ncbi:copper homeostasis protein CutC [Vagococcus elongatus]|uniref:PF03932 family protein CutC n=1 Tax=Vagococcus elongatus TaxID=180344 RepID=A0A430B461_9ENTE|nr:copper homeostasis protein CutC [Vagococcus elongatus]RSU15127.1 copper homeostasis protein CutC [Vagococcus elongatus]
MIKEFCAENFTHIPQAIQNGAKRVELCDNLHVGGTSVSTGVMAETIDYCHEKNVSVMTMIRPREGDFYYNDTELKMMEIDLLEAKKIGADGVVFGCLTENAETIDTDALERLIDKADGLQITFHMAFDSLPKEEQFKAIDWLSENGVNRILTHGGPAGTLIHENFAHLKELIAYANHRLIILPGGGITKENSEEVAGTLGVSEVHGTRIV